MQEEDKNELLAIVDRVSELENQRADIDGKLSELAQKTAAISHKAEMEVFLEADDKGKLRYSNEQLRRAGLNLRLHADEQYQRLVSRSQELRLQDKLLAIECISLKARYQVLMAFSAPGSEKVSFPSLQWEDLDLLATSVGLPAKLSRFLSQVTKEAEAVSQPFDEDAKNKLLQNREQLTRLEQEVEKVDEERSDIRHQIQLIHDQVLLEVGSERDDMDRLVNRSSQLREAALRLRLEQHTEHQRLQTRLRELYAEHESLCSEMSRLRDRELGLG